jgi:hypothetical protein
MYHFEHLLSENYRRACKLKFQTSLPTVAALEYACDLTLVRKTAPGAKRGFDEADSASAIFANKTIRSGAALASANLAKLRINEAQSGVQPGSNGVCQSSHSTFFARQGHREQRKWARKIDRVAKAEAPFSLCFSAPPPKRISGDWTRFSVPGF